MHTVLLERNREHKSNIHKEILMVYNRYYILINYTLTLEPH